MITMPKVFSDNALFQQSSPLALRGKTSPNTAVSLTLASQNAIAAQASCVSDSDGTFKLSITTPSASFEPYTITVAAADESLTISNILFGELWFASGQSNMELTNVFMTECDSYLTAMKDMTIRSFAQEYGSGFPYEPDDGCGGKWVTIDDKEAFKNVSAAGTAFVKGLYEAFSAKGCAIPVGFLNVSWGGTPINAWIPRDAIDSDPIVGEYEKKIGRFPTPENWNTHGDCNFQQVAAMYNLKTHAVTGLSTRGVIWYQGENDCGAECGSRIYKHDLYLFHKVYSELFNPNDGKPFFMISSLLYPFNYGGNGETFLGWLNQAFIDAANEYPDRFAFMPIADLPPVWGYGGNHPIHPTNKFEVGERMARIADVTTYGAQGQYAPATMSGFTVEDSRIIVKFANVGSGLRVNGKQLRGLYIAGENGQYMPAYGEIIAPDTLAVSHPYLAEPKNAAYAFTSFEPEVNLWAGEYPASPFSTYLGDYFRIEGKPWLDLYRDTVWEDRSHGGLVDFFHHPIWKPCPESEVCRDTSFTLSGVSLHICGDIERFGAYVTASVSNRLDLANYKSLRFRLMNCPDDGCKLELRVHNGGNTPWYTVTIPAVKLSTLYGGWSEYEVSFDALRAETKSPDAVERMTFRFDVKGCPYHFVNMENLILVP